MTIDIRPGGLDTESVQALVTAHRTHSLAHSPPESVHSLGAGGLASATAFWAAWDGPTAVGMIALNELGGRAGEIKSMHVLPGHRGSGLATRLVALVCADAAARGLTRLLLETGSSEAYAPARALYARHGFVERGPFPPYGEDPWSVFMERALS